MKNKVQRTMSPERYVDALKKEIADKNYPIELIESFGRVYLKTKGDTFYFEPNNGKIRLMHKNTRVYSHKHEYHEQFKKYISPKGLLTFVLQHQDYRYHIKYVESKHIS